MIRFRNLVLALAALAVSLTLAAPAPVHAQSANEQQAFESYQEAREAFRAGDFDTSARLLVRTRDLLGATNIRIQPLLIRSLVEIEEWERAERELEEYRALNPDRNLVEYQEMMELATRVRQKIEAEAAAHTRAWEQARSQHTMSSYSDYLDRYPSGDHAAQARERIERIDREAYEQAIRTGTQAALNGYLNGFPLGQHKSQVRAALAVRVEDDAYASARSSNELSAYRSYLQSYPDGRHAAEAHAIIGNTYRAAGNNALESGAWSRAVQSYESYLDHYPSGRHHQEVRDRLEKARRQVRISRIPDRTVFGWHGSANAPVGFAWGSAKNRETGMILALRANQDALKLVEDPGYTIDDAGRIDGDPLGDLRLTGEERLAEIEGTLGLTRPLLPDVLWGYAAAGGGYYVLLTGLGEVGGVDTPTEWIRNTDQSSFGWVAEGGLILRVGGIALTGGYAVRQVEDPLFTMGAGFIF